jgi:uncharacterized membrane protein YphA (DoxX/SURF4 family)
MTAPAALATEARLGTFEQVGDIRALSVLRILIGPITIAHLWPFLQDARAGIYYDDHFWQPYLSGAPRLEGEIWAAMLWVGVVGALLMTVGLFTRLATATTLVVVAGNLLLSGTEFRHNRAFLTILLLGLALLPTGRARSVDAWWRRRRGLPALPPVAPLWPLTLLRVQVSLVYFASGFSKLVDPDWLSGLVLWDRAVRYQSEIHPAPGWVVDLATWRPLFWLVAPAAIATELFLATGLWWPRTRLLAIRLAIVFHLSIELTAKVEVFSLAAIAALIIWVTPSAHDRTIRLRGESGTTRLLAGLLPVLDWFGRFRVEPPRPGDPDLVVVDRDGTTSSGRPALRVALERLPLTFPFAPLVGAGSRDPAR